MRLAALLVALVFSGAALAQKEVPVRFALDWRFEGPAAPYLVAIDKGYYKAEGLDVTIDPGSGSVEGINRVASGAYDVGFCDINLLVKYRDNPRNLPPLDSSQRGVQEHGCQQGRGAEGDDSRSQRPRSGRRVLRQHQKNGANRRCASIRSGGQRSCQRH